MLRIHTSTSSAAAKTYYREGLATSDYYQEKGQTLGHWGGKGAGLLGLPEEVNQEHFDRLADNQHPITGDKLTPRTKDNRRVGYDFTFNAPKSLSIAFSLGDKEIKENILDAFESAVKDTMKDIEKDMMTRVRKGGQNHDRSTGNMVYAAFTHDTTRPIDGIPDPHLHTHAYAFNTTFDHIEKRWKAGEFSHIKSDAPYFEALFHNRLAHSLQQMGYAIRQTKDRWELAGFTRDTINRFSNRTSEIDALAEAQGINNPKLKAELAAITRNSKQEIKPWHEVHQDWHRRFFEGNQDDLQTLLTNQERFEANPKDVVEQAIAHSFARNSVAKERTLLKNALKFGTGAVTEHDITRLLNKKKLLSVTQKGTKYFTLRSILNEERALYDVVKQGRGKFRALGPHDVTITSSILNDQQKQVIDTVLQSHDGVTAIIGKSGVGKTTVLKEIRDNIQKTGKMVYAFAPSSDASRGVLRQEGFAGADTVARLLLDKKMQAKMKDNVILIDEAGLVGTPTLNKVFHIAKQQNARVLLVGDPGQHGSVERGDALRLLEAHSGLQIARLGTIVRQKNSLFRDAVDALSRRGFKKAMDKLEEMGAFVEMDDHHERYQQLAQEYTMSKINGKSVLAVSPTHKEGDIVSAYIRERLKLASIVGKKDIKKITYTPLSLTDSEKRQIGVYEKGLFIKLNQNISGFTRGEMLEIQGAFKDHLSVKKPNGELAELSLTDSKWYSLFEPKIAMVSKGDSIRLTSNGKTKYGHHDLYNGREYQIKQIKRDGDIILNNGWILDKSFGHFKHGYVSTSVASQGKGLDNVLIAQSSTSFGKASSTQQFYVSVSRGKHSVNIYTDDIKGLRKQIEFSSHRQSATELMQQQKEDRTSWFATVKEAVNHYKTRATQQFAHYMQHRRPGMTMGR